MPSPAPGLSSVPSMVFAFRPRAGMPPRGRSTPLARKAFPSCAGISFGRSDGRDCCPTISSVMAAARRSAISFGPRPAQPRRPPPDNRTGKNRFVVVSPHPADVKTPCAPAPAGLRLAMVFLIVGSAAEYLRRGSNVTAGTPPRRTAAASKGALTSGSFFAMRPDGKPTIGQFPPVQLPGFR